MTTKARQTTKMGGATRQAPAPRPVDRLIHAAQDVWFDGLITLARAQEDAVRVVETVAGDPRVTGLAGNLVNGLGRIGQGVETGAGFLLGRAGLASRKELDLLSRRVSKLAREVEKLATTQRHGLGRDTAATASPRD